MDYKGSLLLIVIALQYNLTLQQQISCSLSHSLQGLFGLFSARLETWPIGNKQTNSLQFPLLALVNFLSIGANLHPLAYLKLRTSYISKEDKPRLPQLSTALFSASGRGSLLLIHSFPASKQHTRSPQA